MTTLYLPGGVLQLSQSGTEYIGGVGVVQDNSSGVVLATALDNTGPASGMTGHPSAQFAATLDGGLAGPRTVTVSVAGGASVVIDGVTTANSGTFVLTPSVLGFNYAVLGTSPGEKTITLSISAGSAIAMPAPLTYTSTPQVFAPTIAVNGDPDIDGNDVTWNLTLGNGPTSGLASMTATGSGVSQTAIPIDVVLSKAVFPDLAPGTYSAAFSVTNEMGTANTSVASPVTIGEISGGSGGSTPPADTAPPVMSGAVAITAVTGTTATATWQAATDNVGVVRYDLRVNGGAWQSKGTALTAPLTGLVASTLHAVDVSAVDAAGLRSNIVTGGFTTAAAPVEPEEPPVNPGTSQELLSINASARSINDVLNLIRPGEWVESTFEFGPNPEVELGDFLTFYSVDQFAGLRIADWYVKWQQLDTGATPTLKVHVGFGDAGGVSGTAGYRFASDRALGGAVAGGCLRDDNFGSHLQNAPTLRLGISIAALPAVAAFANKRLVFGVLPQSVIYSK